HSYPPHPDLHSFPTRRSSDLHWADPATRELIDYATRRLRSTNVLVLATYRTDEMHRKHALLPTIQGWRRSGQAQLIEIGRLGSQDRKSTRLNSSHVKISYAVF